MMKCVSLLVLLCATCFNAISPDFALSKNASKPMNVVFILADDLGWSDTELYGHTELYKTPNLLRLAERGRTFARAYSNSPLCSPIRASILTGQTPTRHGSTRPQHHTNQVLMKPELLKTGPASEKALRVQTATRLDTAFPTLGKVMNQAGYHTGHFGKWHLGREPFSPYEHGFDVDIPHWPGPGPAGSFVAPWKFKNFKANYEGEHIEDRMAEESIQWMKSLPADKPFFMNYWQFSVHAPFNAKAELIDEYKKVIDPSSAQRSPTYAAMVHSLDDAVGSLLDAIDEKGIADHTIIIFTSDNGGNMYNSIKEDGDVTPTSNAPLRGGKGSIFDGGIRVPCIVVWPGVTTPGSQSDELIQTSNFYPTLLNGLGIPLPENHAIDSIDIKPALQGKKLERKGIFTYFPSQTNVPDWLPPSVAVHSGKWKLIRVFFGGEALGQHDCKLYDFSEDIGEKHNLAAARPELVAKLDRMIEDHLTETKAVTPKPNPNFDPEQFDPGLIGIRVSKKK
ncbi:sulfatase [Verrucomicrobia bacterium]|nr:sulfatase [Verrucomicrobiota bacterium]